MKKWLSRILILIIILLFSGCGTFGAKVTTPNTKSILEGQWKVEAVEGVTLDGYDTENILGSILSFSNEEVNLFGKVYDDISYKAKVVDMDDYLYDTLGYIPGDSSRDDRTIKVITISANNTFIKDIMVIEDSVYIIEDNIIFRLIQTDKTPIHTLNEPSKHQEADDYYNLDSGVLLGLRSEGDDGTEYRTLWIYLQNGNVQIQELPYILLPRKSGFFKVTNKREYNADNYFKDTIVFTDLNGKSKDFKGTDTRVITDLNEKSKELQSTDRNSIHENINVDRDITFIGNDYMSTKTFIYSDSENKEVLNTYILDMNSPGNNISVPLGTLTDIDDMNNIMLSQDKENEVGTEDINKFTNFGIKRKQGRWGFYTLINSDDKLGDESGESTEKEAREQALGDNDLNGTKVDITLKVSEKIARHDEIFMPWQGIQKQVPSAIDAISAPNKNLAIIKTKSKLYIYKIINNNLAEEPELTISLWGKEEIVMAEWAEGDYVGYWTEQVNSLVATDGSH